MPTLYHGTSRAFAMAMCGTTNRGTIDVTRGGGEFGRGFYTQDSLGRAHLWAQYRFPNPAVLVLEINNQEYDALDARRLTLDDALRLNQRLRNRRAQATYTTRHDVIVGPLVTKPHVEQQKFQSQAAQNLLNGQKTQRRLQY